MVEVTERKLKKTIGASHVVSTSAEAAPETLAAPAATQAKPVESRAAEQRSAPPKAAPAKAEDKSAAKVAKVPGNRQGFKTLEYIVYPAHGVGQITAIEEQEVAGYKLELFVISFIKDKMILKVPTPKVTAVGMRKLAEAPVVKRALDTLTGRARVKRTMWSRRAQEYEAKINSGDLVAIAEVVRDLYRSDAQPEQSYSERQLYEAALDRIAREIAAVQKLTDQEALKLIDEQLQKSPRRAKTDEPDAEEDGDGEGIVEAA
jgi:CarD family transcriptional regulator